jgi:hypothetical protein
MSSQGVLGRTRKKKASSVHDRKVGIMEAVRRRLAPYELKVLCAGVYVCVLSVCLCE